MFFQRRRSHTKAMTFKNKRGWKKIESRRKKYDKKIIRRKEKLGVEVAPLEENEAEEIKLTKQSD